MHKTIKIVWRWQWLTSLNLKVLKFWSRDFRYCLCCISLRNVIKIWWHFTKIWRHNGYQADDRPPSCKLIFEVCKLSFSTFITLWFCVFLRESDNPWPNYGQNDIFYTVSDRHCKTKTSLFYYNSAANCLFFLKKIWWRKNPTAATVEYNCNLWKFKTADDRHLENHCIAIFRFRLIVVGPML